MQASNPRRLLASIHDVSLRFRMPDRVRRSRGVRVSMLRPLRILTPLHSFEPGGVERVALRLSAAWVEQGVDALIVLGRGEGAMQPEAPLPLHYRFLKSGGFPTARIETLWMIVRLPAMIRRLSPDILFCAGNTYAIVMLAMRILLGRRCPLIVAKVSNDLARNDLSPPIRWFYRLWLKRQARFVDHFVGMAEPMRAEIAKAMGVGPTRITIVDDPALSVRDLDGGAEAARGPDAGTNFVAAGRLVPQKNFALLIAAFARIAGRSDRLTILGEGSERAALTRLARRLGIEGRVAMPGHGLSVADTFAGSDVFVLSSDYEGVPAVVLEAMAAGLPVVATNCSVSMSHLLQHDRLGLLVPVGDLTALASAMTQIGSRSFCAVAARAHAARFTIERAAGAYIDLFGQVAARAF